MTIWAALLRLAASVAMLMHGTVEASAQKVAPMEDRRFWGIVEQSAVNVREQAQQEANLRHPRHAADRGSGGVAGRL